jgi:hypothetical protein
MPFLVMLSPWTLETILTCTLGQHMTLQVVLLLTICQSLGPCDSNEVAPSGKQHMGIETELTELYEGGKGTNILGQV